ncbi:MAG: IlvD/Edd family dehydratase, partial [Candidatus Nanopelagicaceae bacterium]
HGYIYRERFRNMGFGSEVFSDKPVIGIATTWSELNPCNAHLDRVAEAVKRGVWEAGGFPLEFPTMSLGEPVQRPTTMLWRNLLAMETEELIRSNPLDGVVLLAGCDKTPPGMLMGAASVDLPTLIITGGPMLNGRYKGETLGSGTAVWKYSEQIRAGKLSIEEFFAMESCSARSNGSCMTMGTASTMACVTEALGVQLPGSAAIPAVDARRFSTSQEAGRRIVQMVYDDQVLSKVLTREAFENAIKVNAAIGGSTNAVVHLLAIAGRIGVKLELDDFDSLAREVPVLVNLMPSGKYLMEEFFDAGGLPAVMKEIEGMLHTEHITVSGKSVKENIATAESWNADVITPASKPFQKAGSGIVVLKGSLAPDGCVLKVSAATPALMVHTGEALVFEEIEDYLIASEDMNLPVTKDTVLVLKHAGPRGFPGFPEVGNMPIPRKLLEQGITDMVRISDARMSGTAYGTVLLHTSPEAAVGGPLALVKSGDMIELNVPNRSINLLVSEEEMAKRKAAWVAPAPKHTRGWSKLYYETVQQAHLGADLDFLNGSSGSGIPRHSH